MEVMVLLGSWNPPSIWLARGAVPLVESLRFNDTHHSSPTMTTWRRRVASKEDSLEENRTRERITRNMVSTYLKGVVWVTLSYVFLAA